jgi:hypothetical protein
MLYPVMTHARVARESPEKVRSRAGKATFTTDRSREAMNAPRAVTANTRFRAAGATGTDGGWEPVVSCVIQRTLTDCVP